MADNYLIGNVSGDIAHFRTALEEPLESCKVTFAPVQAGSGDPSPDNIRAISGRTGLELTHSGVNLLKCDTYIDRTASGITYTGTRNAEGEIESIRVTGKGTNSNCFTNLNYKGNNFRAFEGQIVAYAYSDQVGIIAVGDSGSFYVNGKGYTTLNYTDWNQYDIDDQTYNSQHTTKNTATWYRLQTYPYQANVTIDTTVYPMVCLASDAGCEFEPYHGESMSVNWQSQAGTVYGGYIDFVTGELVQTWSAKDMSTMNIGCDSGASYFYITGLDKAIGRDNILCPIYKYSTDAPASMPDFTIKGQPHNTNIFLKDSRYTGNVAGLKSALAGVMMAYELATPVRYQLTPRQINTFKGINNFWSEAGTIDVSYCFKDAPEMLKLRRQIELSSPHVETAEGAIANFRTDIVAPLKECKVSFEPKQDGKGDPSPDNVRAISGWTGVTVKRCGKNLFDEQYYNIPEQATDPVYRQLFVGGSEVVASTSCPRNSNGYAVLYVLSGKVNAGASSNRNDIYNGFSRNIQTINGWMTIGYRASTNNADPRNHNTQIEYGSVATEYEPYNGSDYSIDWQSEVGTVYGGYVDLATGELVETWHSMTLAEIGAIDLGYNTSGSYFFASISDSFGIYKKKIGTANVKCNVYKYENPSDVSTLSDGAMRGSGGSNAIFWKDSRYTSTSSLIQGEGSNIRFCWELDTPIVHSIDPVIFKTLRGRNNIWCMNEACSVDVKYWTHHIEPPSLYQRVEYLECVGRNARINTGVAGNDNTLEFDFTYMPMVQRNYGGNFGNYMNENTTCWRFIQGVSSGPRVYIFTPYNRRTGNSPSMTAVAVNTGSIINIKTHVHLSYGFMEVTSEDGYINWNTPESDGTEDASPNNIAIGSVSSSVTSTYTDPARFYGAFKIWRQGQLIRNYIPCYRKSDHKSGFYDTVNDTFNPSIGTADFVLPS